jgi:hypothetical protein
MPRSDYTISPYGRAACPICGDKFSLTKRGVLRYHLGDIAIGRFRQVCKGVGQPPKVAA